MDIQFLIHTNHAVPIVKTNWLIRFKEIITLYSGNHTIQTNTLGGKNSVLLILKWVIHTCIHNNQSVLKG
jgi:hypothetical protein